MNRPVRCLLVQLGLAGAALTGCSPKPVEVHSMASLQRALPGRGWLDMTYHPVDVSSLAEAGITTAGLIRSGPYRMEVYEVGRHEAVMRVAELLAATGDVVFTGGLLVVLVPAGPDAADVTARLVELGLRRHGPDRAPAGR